MSRREACHELRPLLVRSSDGESSPHDAMRVARHLPDCTACRILLARERRLAEMLANGLEDLPVGEDFVDRVMATLLHEPAPVPRRRNHGLRLAVGADARRR